jgi:hypothetical protein
VLGALERLLDLGPRARVVFAGVYLLGQGALVATGGARPDALFAFRMFNESSTLNVHLARAIEAPSGHGTVLVPVENGTWTARDAGGTMHRFHWKDRVPKPELSSFDATMHASYGAAAQLARWHAALDDVARHIPDDAETRALVLEISVRRNGHEASVVRFERPTGADR